MNGATAAFFLREWSIVRRVVRVGMALLMLGVGFLFAACRASDRYRLLAEPIMLRSVILPSACALGGTLAWVSFVRELRSGTWDSWLLLPRSRVVLAGAKVAVGLASAFVAIATPVVVLFLALRLWSATGGPSISVADLVFRSVLTQGVLVALVAYLATANAALMARAGHVAFLVLPLVPVLATGRFFLGDQTSRLPGAWVAVALVALVVVLIVTLVVSVRRFGRAPGSRELLLRTLVTAPATTVVVLLVGSIASEIFARVMPPAERPPTVSSEDAPRVIGIDAVGRIVTRRGRGRDLVSMYQIKPLGDFDEPPGARLWTPAFSDLRMQLFRQRTRDSFLAFDTHAGAPLGCVGQHGLVPASQPCAPFDGRPSILQGAEAAVILTPRSVHRLDAEGRISLLIRGDIYGGAYVGSLAGLRDEAVVVAVDDGLAILNPTEAVPQPLPQVICHGGSGGARIHGIAIAPEFVALELTFPDAPGRTELAVCRDGVVTSRRRQTDPMEYRPTAEATARRWLLSIAIGPLLSEGKRRLAGASRRHVVAADPDDSRFASLAGAAFLTLALALVVLRYGKRSGGTGARVWWILPGVVLGPGYVLACALVAWRKPRWASLLG